MDSLNQVRQNYITLRKKGERGISESWSLAGDDLNSLKPNLSSGKKRIPSLLPLLGSLVGTNVHSQNDTVKPPNLILVSVFY